MFLYIILEIFQIKWNKNLPPILQGQDHLSVKVKKENLKWYFKVNTQQCNLKPITVISAIKLSLYQEGGSHKLGLLLFVERMLISLKEPKIYTVLDPLKLSNTLATLFALQVEEGCSALQSDVAQGGTPMWKGQGCSSSCLGV